MSQAKIIRSAPFLTVRDIHRALDYYCDVLGFSRPQIWGDPPNFAMPNRDDFIVMLYQADAENPLHPKQGDNWDVYFWVTDADALFAEFQSKGATIEYEPCVQPYENKEFAVRDVDGHVLAFGQHWPAA